MKSLCGLLFRRWSYFNRVFQQRAYILQKNMPSSLSTYSSRVCFLKRNDAAVITFQLSLLTSLYLFQSPAVTSCSFSFHYLIQLHNQLFFTKPFKINKQASFDEAVPCISSPVQKNQQKNPHQLQTNCTEGPS